MLFASADVMMIEVRYSMTLSWRQIRGNAILKGDTIIGNKSAF
jgi:hypothetical protein